MTVVLRGGIVHDVHSGSSERLDIVVEGERIADLAPPGGATAADVIDVHGEHVLPGLIDCHVHLTMRGEDAHPGSSAGRTDDEVLRHAARAARATLLAGITTVRDLGGWNHVEMTLRRMIETGDAAGPRLALAGRLLSMPTPAVAYYPGMYDVAKGADEVRAAARRQLDAGADVVKVMATGAMLSPEDEDAGLQQFSFDELRSAVEEAEARGRPVAAHAHAVEGIRDAVRANAASIEHGTFADQPVLRLMAERGTFLVATLSAGAVEDRTVANAMPPHLRERFEASQSIHVEVIRTAHRLGVPLAMGTDAGTPANHHGRNARECLFLVQEAGLSPAEAIRAATTNGARLLRRGTDLGDLKPGMLADVISVPSDPVEDVGALLDVRFVMKGGVIYRNDLASSG